jgi:membrane associated rhomboid family serine protease
MGGLMSKLAGRIEWPAAIVASIGIVAVLLAYLLGPVEYRADLVGAIAVAWGLVQAVAKALIKEAP